MKIKKMKINKAAVFWMMMGLWAGISHAQKTRDSLQSQTVTVTKSYTPTVRDADKISVNPPVVTGEDFSKKPVSYNPLDIEAVSTFMAEKGKLVRPRISAAYPANIPGYVEFATGNQKAFRLRSFYSHLFPSAWKTGAELGFFSLGNTVRDTLQTDPFYDLDVSLFANHTNRRRQWRFQTDYAGRWASYRDTLTPLTKLTTAFVNHHTGLRAGGEFYEGFLKNTALDYRFLSAYRGNEHNLKWHATTVFPVAGFDISTRFSAALTSGDAGGGYTNFQAGLFPAFRLEQQHLIFYLGFKLYFQNRRDVNDAVLFYPDIRIDYHMIPELLTVYMQYEGDIHTQSYEDMTLENRFTALDTALVPTSVPYHFAGGFRGSIGTRMNYHLKLGVGREKNHPFLQLASLPEGLAFVPVYDRLDYFYFKVHLSYVANENFETKIKFDYFQNSPAELPKAWNMEDYKLSWLMRLRAGKFGLRSDVYYIGPRYNFWNNQVVKTGEIVDVNLKLSYNIFKTLYLYVEGNNLLNRNDFIYYGYPVHGLHILGGITYSFK